MKLLYKTSESKTVLLMMRTYRYNYKADRAFAQILQAARKTQGIRIADLQRSLNLKGICVTYTVLGYMLNRTRCRSFSPVETLALIELLGLDPKDVYKALLLVANDDLKAKQVIQDAVSKGK